eukprot:5518656-Alexandrium_andersonii.AAC.1
MRSSADALVAASSAARVEPTRSWPFARTTPSFKRISTALAFMQPRRPRSSGVLRAHPSLWAL